MSATEEYPRKAPMATDDIIGDIDEDTPEYNDQDVVDDIERNIETLEVKIKDLQAQAVSASEKGDPETLSTVMLRLARINSALGKNAAKAMYIARNADRAARRHRASKTLAHASSMAVNKAELSAEIDSKEVFQTASDAQLIADQASDLGFRTDTFLKLCQSRLSLIKSDIARG